MIGTIIQISQIFLLKLFTKRHMSKNKKLSDFLYERALPNEYLVELGKRDIVPVLGGKRFKWFKRFVHVPAYVQRLHFTTDNANMDYQGIGIEGFAAWRINPQKPHIAISTLDLFDEEAPLEKTNNDLKTICIEAVRHVIANMNIEDAMRKKDEIAGNLQKQLSVIEEKWGIVFDQVSIEKVTVMSSKLFQDLQAAFRNQRRLESAKIQINTDLEIASEENAMKEKTAKQQLAADQRLELLKIENNHVVKERQIDENKYMAEKEVLIAQEKFRSELMFKLEKEQKEHELSILGKNLELDKLKYEEKLLEEKIKIEQLKNQIATGQIEIAKLQREMQQSYSKEELSKEFLLALPKIFDAIHIQNYSVMESGNGNSFSPVSKIMNEMVTVLKNNGIALGNDPDTN